MHAPFGALVVAATFASNVAHADVSSVSLRYAVGATFEACAVEVTIDAVDQNLVNLQETLIFDGTDVASFGDIEPTISMIRRNDSVLFGSPAFQTWAQFQPDAMLTDADCLSLMAGSTLSFRGSFGEDAGSLTLPSDYDVLSAFDGNNWLDLETDGLELFSLTSVIALGVFVATGCGCATVSPWGTGLPLVGLLGLVALRRRRKA